MSDVLVFGRTGQLAQALVACSAVAERGWSVEALGRDRLDLLDADADIAGAIAAAQPRFVVNASAYTAVDRAEDEPEAAERLNVAAPAAMAHACAAAGVPFVHISTDYVFDGRGGAPYRETDTVSPTGVYGASKARGEAAVQAMGGRSVSLRTSWVYSATGANFVRTMLRLARDREELGVVADQRGRPTSAEELADGAVRAGVALASGALEGAPIVHLCGGGEADWAEFATAIFDASAKRGGPRARVRPITTAEYPTRATRPPDSRLDGALAEARLDWRPQPWRVSLDRCIGALAAEF